MFTRIYFLVFFFSVFSNVSFSQDLFTHVRNGNLSAVKKIIKHFPDSVNAQNDKGFSVLMIASYRNQTKIGLFLLKKGANPNSNSDEGQALQAAAYTNNFVLVKKLIEYKANVHAQGPDGNNAIAYAVMSENVEMCRFLLKNGADPLVKNKSNSSAKELALAGNNEQLKALFP